MKSVSIVLMSVLLAVGTTSGCKKSETTSKEATETPKAPDRREATPPKPSEEKIAADKVGTEKPVPPTTEGGSNAVAKPEPVPPPQPQPQPQPPPPPPPAVAKIVRVVTGAEVTCALRDDGRILCWGSNERGLLGVADQTVDSVSPQLVPGLEADALWLSESNSVSWLGSMYGGGSYNTACARARGTGAVSCWGNDELRVLQGGKQPQGPPAPFPVAALQGAVGMDFGGGTSCAALKDGKTVCWGNDTFKALGRTPSDTEKVGYSGDYTVGAVEGVAGAVEVAVGQNHGCARTAAGELWCWGEGKPPAKVADAALTAPIVSVTASPGQSRSCVADAKGAVACGDRGSWSAVAGVSDAVEVTSVRSTVCTRSGAGAVQCWCTSKEWSFLGCDKENTPAAVALPEPATQIDLGNTHACAVLASGKVACWGYNRRGQLGDGTLTDRKEPVLVAGLEAATTTVPPLPAGAELPPVEWPGAGLDACAATTVTGEATFAPRTALVTPSRTVEGDWHLNLVMGEDVFTSRDNPLRPRGRGVVLELNIEARTEVQRSPNGNKVVYASGPLAIGSFTQKGTSWVQIRGMNRLRDIKLRDDAKVELTHLDMDSGVVCGTIDGAIVDAEQHVRGRFAARIDAKAIAAAARVDASTPLGLKPVLLANGTQLSAIACEAPDLVRVSHAGKSLLKSFTTNGKRMVVRTEREQFVILDVQRSATSCGVTLAKDMGVGGQLLPDYAPDSISFDAAGGLLALTGFGDVGGLGADSVVAKGCRIKDGRKLRTAPGGALVAIDTSPVQLLDSATCAATGTRDTTALGKCTEGGFLDKTRLALLCEAGGKNRLTVVDAKGKAAFTVGGDDYSQPDRLTGWPSDVGPCGGSVCVRDGDSLQVWKGDGTFAGKVDLREVTGATKVLDAEGDSGGMWLLVTARRGESSSYETSILRLTGFTR